MADDLIHIAIDGDDDRAWAADMWIMRCGLVLTAHTDADGNQALHPAGHDWVLDLGAHRATCQGCLTPQGETTDTKELADA